MLAVHRKAWVERRRSFTMRACCGRSPRLDLAGALIHGSAEDLSLRYRVWGKGAALIIEI